MSKNALKPGTTVAQLDNSPLLQQLTMTAFRVYVRLVVESSKRGRVMRITNKELHGSRRTAQLALVSLQGLKLVKVTQFDDSSREIEVL